MNDYTMQVLIQSKGMQETYYLQEIERAANTVSDERKMLARFLADHPEMEEFLTGDVVNGYEYVPGKVKVASEELLDSMKPANDLYPRDICDSPAINSPSQLKSNGRAVEQHGS